MEDYVETSTIQGCVEDVGTFHTLSYQHPSWYLIKAEGFLFANFLTDLHQLNLQNKLALGPTIFTKILDNFNST